MSTAVIADKKPAVLTLEPGTYKVGKLRYDTTVC